METDAPQGPSWESIPETDTRLDAEPEPDEEETDDDTPDDEGDEDGDREEETEQPRSPEPRKYAGRYETPEDLEKAYTELQRKLGEQGNELGQLRRGQQPSEESQSFEPHKLGRDGNYRDELGVVYYTSQQWDQFTREKLVPAFTGEDGDVDVAGLTLALVEAKEKDRERYNGERQSMLLSRERSFQTEAARMRQSYAPAVEKVLGKEVADGLFARVDEQIKQQPPESRTDPNIYRLATAAALGLMIMDPEAMQELGDAVEQRTAPARPESRPAPSTRPGGGSRGRRAGKVPDAYKDAVARGELSAEDAIKYGSDSYILET